MWRGKNELTGFGLWLGERRQWSGGRRERIAKRSRSATAAAEPQTEARRFCGTLRMPARDERTVCEVERVRPRGEQGRPDIPWSAAKPYVGHGGFVIMVVRGVGCATE